MIFIAICRYAQIEDSSIESNDAQDLDEEATATADNLLGDDYYPEVEVDDNAYESSGGKDYYFYYSG